MLPVLPCTLCLGKGHGASIAPRALDVARSATDSFFPISVKTAAKFLLLKPYVSTSFSFWPDSTANTPPRCCAQQASALYETIESAESIDESGLPESAYTVPEGQLGGTAPLDPTTGRPTQTGGKEGERLFDAGAEGAR